MANLWYGHLDKGKLLIWTMANLWYGHMDNGKLLIRTTGQGQTSDTDIWTMANFWYRHLDKGKLLIRTSGQGQTSDTDIWTRANFWYGHLDKGKPLIRTSGHWQTSNTDIWTRANLWSCSCGPSYWSCWLLGPSSPMEKYGHLRRLRCQCPAKKTSQSLQHNYFLPCCGASLKMLTAINTCYSLLLQYFC